MSLLELKQGQNRLQSSAESQLEGTFRAVWPDTLPKLNFRFLHSLSNTQATFPGFVECCMDSPHTLKAAFPIVAVTHCFLTVR